MAGRCRTVLAPAKAARNGGMPRDPPCPRPRRRGAAAGGDAQLTAAPCTQGLGRRDLRHLGSPRPDTVPALFRDNVSRHCICVIWGHRIPTPHLRIPRRRGCSAPRPRSGARRPEQTPTSPGRAPTGRRGSPVVPPCCLLQWDKPGCCDAVLVELSRDGWYRAWGPRGIAACTASSLPRAAGGDNTPGRPGCSHGTDPGSGGSLGGQRGCDPTASSRGEKMRQNKKITLKIHWFPKAEAS